MIFLQCFADCNGQQRSADDGNGCVKNGGREFGDHFNPSGFSSQSRKQKAIVEVALGQINKSVGQGAGGGTHNCLHIATVVTDVVDEACHQAVKALGKKGDPAFGDVGGVEQNVIQGATQSCCCRPCS